jgi:hypothetical protein
MTTQSASPVILPGDLASLSPDGKYLVDESTLSNIVPNDTNGVTDVFVYDTVANTFQRISVADNGTQGNNDSFTRSNELTPGSLISADDRYVVFTSRASNIVSDDPNGGLGSIFVYDRNLNQISIVPGEVSNQDYGWPSISANGQYVAFEASNVIYVYDRFGNTPPQQVPGTGNSSAGSTSDPAISGNGKFVVYVRNSTDGLSSSICVYDRTTGNTQTISTGARDFDASISDDGKYVVYLGDNLDNVWQVYLYDRSTGTTTLVSDAADGTPGNAASAAPIISGDGKHIYFVSNATNLGTPNNGYPDVYSYDVQTGQLTQVYAPTVSPIYGLTTSDDGRYLAFSEGFGTGPTILLDLGQPPTLFTTGADTVDFNNLTQAQIASINGGANLYDAQAGDDTVTLPDAAHYQLTSTVSWDPSQTFNLGAGRDTVKINGTTMPTNVIGGFVLGDTFDLTGIPFDSRGIATLVNSGGANDVLQINENGKSYQLNLTQPQLPIQKNQSFQLSSDGSGGTDVQLLPGLAAGFDVANFPGLSLMNSLYQNTNLSWAGYYLNAVNHTTKSFPSSWSGNWNALTSEGWKLVPIYVGRQNSGGKDVVTEANVTEANAMSLAYKDSLQAVQQDVPQGQTIYFDIESGKSGANLTPGELDYIYDWCTDIAACGYFPGIYATPSDAKTIASIVPGVPFWIFNKDYYNSYPPPNGGVVLPTPALSQSIPSGFSGEVQGWQYLINNYNFSLPSNVSLNAVDLDSFAPMPVDDDNITEKPLVVINQPPPVTAGGSILLGIIMGAVDSDDVLSVTISGVPSFEKITAADGATPTVTTNDGKTFNYTFNALPESDWNNGLILSSNYSGKGRPTNTLTVTVSNTTAGESASAAVQTVKVTDPPTVVSSQSDNISGGIHELTGTAPMLTANENPQGITNSPTDLPTSASFGLMTAQENIGRHLASSTPPNSPPGLDHVVALFNQFIAAGFPEQHGGAITTNALSQVIANEQQFLANPHHG